MRRGLALGLLLGWLFGVGSALAVPELIYERRSVVMGTFMDADQLAVMISRDGWIVVRAEAGPPRVFELRRPRLRLR